MPRNCKECAAPIPSDRRLHAEYCSDPCGNRFRGRKYDKLNPEKVLTNRARQNDKAPSRILSRVKHRAKRMGVPFNIDPSDIIIPDVCPVLGIEINPRVIGKSRGYNPECASVDRIRPELGYVKGNVRIISGRANVLKSNATVEELTAVLEDLKRLHCVEP